jgi:polyisoprenyl-teichoic acid--peptidoglycan teichoic acid transferase
MTQLTSPPRGASPGPDQRAEQQPVPRPAARPGATVAAPLRSPRDREDEAARVRFRRALTLLGMTLVLPGSAQLVLGRRAVGLVALRVWLGCWALLLLGVVAGSVSQGFVFWVGLNPGILGAVRLGLCALAVGWALLFLDAWRLGEPLALRQRQRLVVVGLNGALCFVVVGALLFGSHLVAVHRDLILAVSGDGAASAAHDGRYNVLLVGGDSGAGRWGLRTDSLTVASIDAETGRTILFGLPRNMTDFPFPEDSVLGAAFPDGYDCDTCTLNSLATWAADHEDQFGGAAEPGVAATIQGVEGITGLEVNYYAMVDLDGFRNLVAAMGGLTLNVRDRIPIGLPVRRYIEPGVRELNGFETLWFARSRESADDYSRMARQKCVMSAMLQQLSPQLVITRFAALAKAGEDILHTNLPTSELDTFAQLALKARSQKISTVSFVPPAISTSSPDIAKIRSMIETAVDRSEGDAERRPARSASKGFTARSDGPSTGGSIGSLSGGYRANQADDLSQAC